MAAILQDEERPLLCIATDQVEDHIDLLSQNLLELRLSAKVIPGRPDIGLPVSSLAIPENLIKCGTCTEAEVIPEFERDVWAAAEKARVRKLIVTVYQLPEGHVPEMKVQESAELHGRYSCEA
jgi:hypothetical protein